jgi:hypothetical protein
MPIGMDRDVSDGVTVIAGEYPQKAAVVIENLEVETYGALLATLSSAPNGKTRPISGVLLICNPTDYFQKVMPATTIRATDGSYAKEVFPFPTTVIQSPAVTAGSAVMGLGDKYFMGIGAGNAGGNVEFSDDFKFLDDERVYLTKLYGNGRALDNNAFVRLDISGLTPAKLKVVIENYVQALKALTVASVAGATSGKTAITVSPSITAGNTYKYKTAASVVQPAFDDVLTTGWTAWNGTADITATTGNKIAIVEVDASNQAKAYGEVAVTSKA